MKNDQEFYFNPKSKWDNFIDGAFQWTLNIVCLLPIVWGLVWMSANALDKEAQMQDQIVNEWVK